MARAQSETATAQNTTAQTAKAQTVKAWRRFYASTASSTDRFSFSDYKRAVLSKRASVARDGVRLTKLQKIEMALRQPGGASLRELRQITGWQAHSVRGAISGALKKKRGLTVTVQDRPRPRRYLIVGPSDVAAERATGAAGTNPRAPDPTRPSRCAAAKLFRLACAEGARTR